MMNVLVEKTEIVQDEMHQEFRSDYKTLKAGIKAQRDENEILWTHNIQLLERTSQPWAICQIFKKSFGQKKRPQLLVFCSKTSNDSK